MPSGISHDHVAKFLALGITCTHDDKIALEKLCPRQVAGYFPTDGPAYNADDLYSVRFVFCMIHGLYPCASPSGKDTLRSKSGQILKRRSLYDYKLDHRCSDCMRWGGLFIAQKGICQPELIVRILCLSPQSIQVVKANG